MMIKNFVKQLRNIPGWSTGKKIVIFESDDWGSTRLKDIPTLNKFKTKGYNIDNCWMSSVDSLEKNEDLEDLLEVLSKHKDKNGNNPCFTFFINPANPDFQKIKNSEYQEYHYQPFSETLKNYSASNNVIQLYLEGANRNLLDLQYHGREHLYVNRWMRDLQSGNKDTLFGFENDFWGFSKSYTPNLKHDYRASYDLDTTSDLNDQKKALHDGLIVFKDTLKCSANTFVAPNGPINLSLITSLTHTPFIGLPKVHHEPLGENQIKRRYFFLGKKIGAQQIALTRNAVFEPGSKRIDDWVDNCMKDIQTAFFWKKPAIICTHRANFMSRLSHDNKRKGLKELDQLIKKIITKWPDVIFMSSSSLGKLITKTT